MTTAAGRWAAVSASVRGASHNRDGRPNQDAVRVVQVRGNTPGLVAAVCDGHGGDRYVRSDVGSRLGVEVACDVGRRALEDLGPSPSASTVEARLSGVVAESIVARWRERVLDDYQHRAFSDEERARAGVPLDGDPHISYGATLLLAIMAPSWVGLLQIGDGDVTVVRPTHAESPVPTDDRLIGGETTSLCLPTAVADARRCVLVEPLPEMVILTSDGYANSFASPTWRTDAGIDLRDHVRRIGLDGVETRLPSWLADSATAGGDDVSMALIQRVDVAANPVAARATSRTPATSVGASAPRSQHRGLIPATLAIVALAGGAAGWILGQADEPAAQAEVTLAATSTSAFPTTSPTDSPTTTTPRSTTTSPPSTTRPATASTVAIAPPVALTLGEQPQLLAGDGDGLVLTFDSTLPNPTESHFMGWVQIVDGPPELPPPWRFADGQLSRDGKCRQLALVVSLDDNYIRAVGADGVILTSYDLQTGSQLGQVLIQGTRASGATKTDSGQLCGSVSQDSSAPGTTGQGG